MKKSWKKLSSKKVHENPWWGVREDEVIRPTGEKGYYYVLTKHPAVSIVAMNEKQEVLLIHLFRYPTGMFSWETPAGGTEGKAPLKAAQWELTEEAGLRAKKWQSLGKMQAAVSFADEICHIYLATKLESTKENKQAEEGITEAKFVSWSKVFEMIRKGEITDSHSITALTVAALELKILKC